VVGQKFTERWKHPLIVDNRPGAAETSAPRLRRARRPDGYHSVDAHRRRARPQSIAPRKLAVHAVKEFAPITLVGRCRTSYGPNPSVPW